MANINETTAPTGPRRHRWLRIVGIAVGILVVLLVVFYFVATSSAFFKGVILPRVSQSMNAKVTVADASISPFSKVILRDLKVQTTGAEPLVSAPEVRLRYSLWAIIRGNIKVDEVALVQPVIQVVQNPDGSSNLDPLTKKEEPKKAPEAEKPSEPAKVDIKKISISNGTVRQTKLYAGNFRDTTELANVNVTLENLKNGETAKLALGSDITIALAPPPPGTNGTLQAKLNGALGITFSPELKPTTIKGDTRLNVEKAGGSFADVNGLAVNLDADVTPTEVRTLALRFQKSGNQLGRLQVSGPFDMAKTEGNLNVQLLSLDRQVLNLAGAASGLDFGQTVINSSNRVQLANAGKLITAIGGFYADKFSVTRNRQTTPALDLRANYNVTVNQNEQKARVDAFTVTGTQNQQPLLEAGLAGPMTVAWGNTANPAPESALNLVVTNFNLADWKPFLGDIAPAGRVNLVLNMQSRGSGKQLALTANTRIDGLTVKTGTNVLTQLTAGLSARGSATDLKQVKFDELKAELGRQGPPFVTVSGNGTYNQETSAGDLNLSLSAGLAQLVNLLSMTNATFTSGTVDVQARLVPSKTAQNATGKFALANLTGRYGANVFENYGALLDFDIGVTENNQRVEIRKAAGSLRSGAKPGGNFDLAGNLSLDTNKPSSQLTVKLVGLNENALQPFLAPSFGEKKLVSILLNANLATDIKSATETAVKGNLLVTNLVVVDPKVKVPPTPLDARLQLDTSIKDKVLELRQLLLGLTPTAKAKNEAQLTGRLDMSRTNALAGNLKLSSEALDVTSYYDLFAGKPTPATNAPGATAPAQPPPSAPPAPQEEPPAMDLGISDLSVDATIGRFYLREIDIANFQLPIRIRTNIVSIKPAQLTLNGAPAKASVDLNLGVKGYAYDMTLNGDKLPLEPLANTFKPEDHGKYKGELIADVQVKGAGTTGASLRKSLAGQVQLVFTNANIQVVSPRLRKILVPIAMVLAAPELAETPLEGMHFLTRMGDGQVQVTSARLRSPLFLLDTAGSILIADQLTNSPIQNWPVEFSLRRSIAEKIRVSSGTGSATDFVRLPNFLKLAGTLGSPDPKIDKVALAGGFLQKVLPNIPGVDPKTGNLLQGIGGMLTQPRGTNQPAGTNPPGQQPNLLQGLQNVIPGMKPATNPPATKPGTNQPAAPNIFQGLGGLLQPRTAPPAGQTNPPPATNPPANPFNRLFPK